jgi:hypothetical protein
MDTEAIKLLTWKLNGMNQRIQDKIVELDKMVSEREVVENELGKLNSSYYTQKNETNK